MKVREEGRIRGLRRVGWGVRGEGRLGFELGKDGRSKEGRMGTWEVIGG